MALSPPAPSSALPAALPRALANGKAIKEPKPPKVPKESKKKKGDRADRSAENFLRIAHGKHDQLSMMADNKAHLMLTICVGVIGVSATQVFDPQLQYAAITLIISSLVAAGFAVYATKATLPRSKEASLDDPGFNIVFFASFARLPYEQYQAEMERLLADRAQTNRALIKDLYSLGTVLNGRKFRYLDYCYRTFFAGLLLGVLVLVVTLATLWR